MSDVERSNRVILRGTFVEFGKKTQAVSERGPWVDQPIIIKQIGEYQNYAFIRCFNNLAQEVEANLKPGDFVIAHCNIKSRHNKKYPDLWINNIIAFHIVIGITEDYEGE